MARINLLPWRAARRKEQQREFFTRLGLSAVAAVALAAYAHVHINGMIDYQQRRNDFINSEIAILDKKIKEIKELESTRKALLARMEVIQDLQVNRPSIVHLFDQLVRTLPDGTYLTNVKQNNEKLSIGGKAESNARVSAYMRQLEASDWLADPSLGIIETAETADTRVSTFQLEAVQTAPGTESDEPAPDTQQF